MMTTTSIFTGGQNKSVMHAMLYYDNAIISRASLASKMRIALCSI